MATATPPKGGPERSVKRTAKASPKKAKRRTMSADTREKLRQAQLKRWAATKKSAKKSAKEGQKNGPALWQTPLLFDASRTAVPPCVTFDWNRVGGLSGMSTEYSASPISLTPTRLQG
jgi:hypothetical protein